MSKLGKTTPITYKNIKLLLRRKIFIKGISDIRKKYGIPKGGYKTNDEYRLWFIYQARKENSNNNLLSNYSEFLSDINSLRIKLVKSIHWNYFLETYATRGEKIKSYPKLRTKRNAYSPLEPTIVEKEYANGEKIKLVQVRFFSNTKITDMKSVWPAVKKLQKTLSEYDKTRNKTKLNRDIKLVGKSIEEYHKNLHFSLNPDDIDNRENDDTLRKAKSRIEKEIS